MCMRNIHLPTLTKNFEEIVPEADVTTRTVGHLQKDWTEFGISRYILSKTNTTHHIPHQLKLEQIKESATNLTHPLPY